jgi:hypothetical protein
MWGIFLFYSSINGDLENSGYKIMQLRDSKHFTLNLMLVKAQLLQDVSEFEVFPIVFSDTLLNDYDRIFIFLDAVQCGLCQANGVSNICDFSVGPVLYIRVQFNEPGKY